jgi:hypothetical protein
LRDCFVWGQNMLTIEVVVHFDCGELAKNAPW